MKQCKQCNINIEENLDYCPLCASLLSGDDTGCVQSYPKTITFFRKYNLVLRILIFLSIVASVICLVVNWQFPTSPYWSLLVVGGIIYCWAATMISIKKGYNSGMNIWIQMLVSSVFVLLVDLLLGFHRWSLSIAIPTICIVGNIAMIIMMIIRHFDLKDFIIYILASCLYGMIPLIFFLLNWVDIKWICLSSAAFSLIVLIGAFVFADRKTKLELKKRLHL